MNGRLVLFLLLTIIFTRVFAADVTYGFLKCALKTDIGAPIANEKVVVSVADQKLNCVTDANGSFSSMVQSGDVTIQALGTTKNVKVIEGETTDVQFVIVKPGISLTINNMIEDINYSFIQAYMLDGKSVSTGIQKISLGKYFMSVPEEATAFSIIVYLYNYGNKAAFPLGYVHKIWNFDTKDPRRNLTMDYLKPVVISFKMLNEDNTVLANDIKITGKLSWVKPANQNFDDWLKIDLTDNTRPASTSENNDYIRFNATVTNGMITIPECMPGMTYNLQLSIENGMRGAPMYFKIDETGKPDTDNYKFLQRQVIQTVFDTAGQPAANAEVNASYVLNGKINIISAKADNNGIVTWKGLPDNRVTIWGENIPAGVISAEAINITTPLLPPNNTSFAIKVTSPDSAVSGSSYFMSENDQPVSTAINIYSPDSYAVINGRKNSLVSLYLMTSENKPRYKILEFYAPFNDFPIKDAAGDITPILEIKDYKPANKQHIKILNADKVTPAQFSSVKIYPDELIKSGCLFNYSLTKTITTGDGVDLWYSLPGIYQVYVDINEGLDFPVATINLPGDKDITVVMPEITGKVPGGSLVAWIGTNEPTETHVMRFLASSKEMPVYADKNGIIAWWCKTSPKTMMVWKNGKLDNLFLRTFNIKQVDENGKPAAGKDIFNYNNHLASLFPIYKFYDDVPADIVPISTEAISGSEYSDIKLPNKSKVNLWTARYILNQKSGTMPTSILDITKDTPENINLVKSRTIQDNQTAGKVQLFITMSQFTKKPVPQRDFKIIFDNDENNPQLYRYYTPPYIKIPPNAKKMTIIFSQFGICKDKPIEIKDGKINLTTDDFLPLKTLRGKVYDSTGKPFKGVNISVRNIDFVDVNCIFNTNCGSDTDGNYSVADLSPGRYELICRDPYGKQFGYFVATIPEEKPETIFDINLTTITPNGYRDSNYFVNNASIMTNYSWWLFENNNAVQMATGALSFPPPKSQLGKGCMYFMSTSAMRNGSSAFVDVRWSSKKGTVANYKLTPDINITSNMPNNLNYPSIISVSGTGAWEGVTYRQQIQWTAYSGIEIITARISGFPPGKWKIKLFGDKIIEKEIIMKDTAQNIRLEL